MTNDLIERVARAVHEHLCRRNIMQYLDNNEDCHGIAQAAIAAIDLPGQREAAAMAALEAAEFAFVAPGVWTAPWKLIRAIDPAAFRGDDHATG